MNNVHISGAGTFSGGTYEEIHVSGSGRWEGNVKCRRIHISGAVIGGGDRQAEEKIHVSGSLKTKGEISCDGEMHISGALATDGNVSGKEIHISGGGKCGSITGTDIQVSGAVSVNHLHADQAILSGGFKVENDVEAEKVTISGSGTIKGLLNADEVEISAGYREGSITIGGIGGSRVLIKKPEPFSLFGIALSMKPSYTQSVVTDTIEADEVDLESTRARIVRGVNIRIGKGCEIDRIEYSGTIEHEPSAVIREIVQIN